MPDDIVLTESSAEKLRAELDILRTTKRAELADALRKARAFGDLSENFEYHAARRDQAILNGRIADLEKTLEIATIVADDAHTSTDVVGMGSVVKVRDLDENEEIDYRLVDPVQADPVNDLISVHSPVGQALTGRAVGDIVEVKIPAGLARYQVLAIGR